MTAEPDVGPDPGGTAIRVLLVEENPAGSSHLRSLLDEVDGSGRAPFVVRSVDTLPGALRHAGWAQCVLLDLGLPDADGEAIDRLLAGPDRPAIVALTGSSDHGSGIDSIARAAMDSLSKDRLTPDLLSSVVRHVVERHRVRRRLRESEQRVREVISSLPIAVLLFDVEHRIFEANPAAEELTGRGIDDLMGRSMFDSEIGLADETGAPLHPAHSHVVEVVAGTSVLGASMQLHHESGEVRWIDVSHIRIDPGGGSPYTVASCRDITDRRRLDRALDASDARFRTLLQHSRDTLLIVDADGIVRFITPNVERLTGHVPEDVVGRAASDFLVEDERDDGDRRLHRVMDGHDSGVGATFRLLAVDGSERRVQTRAVPLFDDPAVDGVMLDVHDVTHSVARLEALRDSEQRHRALLAAAPSGIGAIDGEGVVTFANEHLCEMVGLTAEEALGRRAGDLVHRRHRTTFEAALVRLGSGGDVDEDITFQRLDGRVRRVHLASRSLADATGEFAGAIWVVTDLTDQRQIEQRARLQAELLDAVGEAVVATDAAGAITYWNAAATELYGWEAHEVLGRDVIEVTPATASAEQAEQIMEAMRTGQTWSGDFHVRRRDGTSFPVRVSNSPIFDDRGAVAGIIGVSFDITDQVAAQTAVQRQVVQLAAVAAVGELAASSLPTAELFHQSVERAVAALDADIGELVLADLSAGGGDRELTLVAGVGTSEGAIGSTRRIEERNWLASLAMIGNKPVVSEDLEREDRFETPAFLLEAGARSGAITVLRTKGEPVGVLGVFARSPRRFVDTEVNALQSIANVVAHALERDEVTRELGRRAVTDELTGLPNRTLYLDRLAKALSRRDRRPGEVAVLFADIDRFKDVNDALGHAAGDELLCAVCDVLQRVVGADDTVARFGGDEFAVLCERLVGAKEAVRLATRIIEALDTTSIEIEGRQMVVSVSIGLVLPDVTSEGQSPESLLRDADAAMYRAKSAGGGRVEQFDELAREQILRRLDLTNDLRAAIAGDQLELLYQPEVDLRTGEVWAEALVRWRHPDEGMLSPTEFIGLAEDTGLIVPLGTWVLERAVAQIIEWSARPAGTVPTSVSVNISARQLIEGDLVDTTKVLLAESGIDPSSLWVELTETSLLREPERSLEALHELKDLGVGLAIDDFGTGFSSLAWARQLPVDALKIDKSFVDGIGIDARDEGIVRTVVEMADAFGIIAIAEGVETAVQLAFLRDLGCHFAQGYHLRRPGLPAEIEEWTAERQRAGGRDPE